MLFFVSDHNLHEQDYQVELFVFANSPKHAAQLWHDNYNYTEEVTILEPEAARPTIGDFYLSVRTLPKDGPTGALVWGDIPIAYFPVEFSE